MIPINTELMPRVPKIAFWEITDACNLRCVHCENEAGTRRANELTETEAMALVEALHHAGCETVILTGGEPLLRKDWFQIAQRCVALGMVVRVVSNGLLIDKAMVEKLLTAGVSALGISLDGDEASHNTIRVGPGARRQSVYAAAVRAIEISRAALLRTDVVTQINQRNLHDLPRMFEQMVSLGVNVWQLQLCMPLGRLMNYTEKYLISPSDLPFLMDTICGFITQKKIVIAVADNIGYYSRQEPQLRGSLRKRNGFWTGCQAGCRCVAICSDGMVKGCPSHPREFGVGRLREESFDVIWDDAARFSYNTQWNIEQLLGECASCAFRAVCRAGCTSMAYAVTGTIYDNPFCYQRVKGIRGESGIQKSEVEPL